MFREDSLMWFADKLGPVPKASPQGKAHPQAATPASGKAAKNAQGGGSQPKGQAPRAQPAAAPEAPKKKKGWF